jgi:hypothetical protein
MWIKVNPIISQQNLNVRYYNKEKEKYSACSILMWIPSRSNRVTSALGDHSYVCAIKQLV